MLFYWDDVSAEDWLSEYQDRRELLAKADAARQSFRDIAVRLGAFDQGELLASWTVKAMRFNLSEAVANLKHLSTEFATVGEDREHTYRKLDAALKFSINRTRKFYSPQNYSG
jgi:hypothetical protein